MAMQELFTTSFGLLSLFTIAFVIVIAVFLYRFAMRNMREDELKARQAQGSGQASTTVK